MFNTSIKYLIIVALLLAGTVVHAQMGFRITALEKEETYLPGERYTLVMEVVNTSNTSQKVNPQINLPETWDLITQPANTILRSGEKKLLFYSMFIPTGESPGTRKGVFNLLNNRGETIVSKELLFTIEEHHNLTVEKLISEQFIQAGELIETTFEIRNDGNVSEKVILSSRNLIEGKALFNIAADSTVLVKVVQPTNEKDYSMRQVTTNLEVENSTTGTIQKAFSSTKVIPTKVAAKDAYLRYPMEASIYHNSYTSNNMSANSQYFEVRGNGHLDSADNHFLNLLIRAPKQASQSRFGVTDQYSFIYKYKDRTTVYLGDHSFNMNRLGFTGRFGMGIKVDQKVNNWLLSGFYTKPRLFSYTTEPTIGAKAVYRSSDYLKMGISVSHSKEIAQYYNYQAVKTDGQSGQIAVFEVDYQDETTTVRAELATSMTSETMDYATDFNLSHRMGKLFYNGSVTMAGENYFGTLSNSTRYSNSLNYNLNKWNFGIGHGYSQVHERVDSTLFGARPSFENYYAAIGYRVNRNHYFNVRASHRSREDQSDLQSFNYREKGITYRYRYTREFLTLNVSGTYNRTQNLIGDNNGFRDTYGHSLGAIYKMSQNFSVRGNFSHNRTNRYNQANINTDFFLYGTGINYNVNRMLRFSGSYNSGFSPEDTYRKRDFINASVMVKKGRNHQLEARVNYFITPNTINNKEVFAYVKYTYRFGAPLKKILKQGGVSGQVVSNDPSIDLRGVQFMAVGNSVRSDRSGRFELNNLPEGDNYVILDESTLPRGIVSASQIPLQVDVSENQKESLQIELVKAVEVRGQLQVENAKIDYNLKGYLKLQNDSFTYYVESDKEGNFKLNQVVPGSYKLSLIRLKNESNLLATTEQLTIDVKDNAQMAIFKLKAKERSIKFKNKEFKVGQ
ncbi:hypothetical protein [Reichenbachiella sp. MALMAid0571]|uniref:hypothetical protein n=1 Tax=Reichenbachiella sp. MALMAid0571 TaxID=3143939 RepID=UPI0032DF5BDD